MKRSLPVLVMGIFACMASMVAHAYESTLAWGAVTEFTDGTPITTPVTYRIYIDTALLNTVTGANTFYVGSYSNPKACFTVRAVVNGEESADSPKFCSNKTPVKLTPKASASLTGT